MHIKTLNYKDTLFKVVEETYPGRKFYMLDTDAKMYCIGLTYTVMQEYVKQQRKRLTQS